MSNPIPDDVFALYSRFGLDEQEYRTFAPLQSQKADSKAETPDIEASEESLGSHQKNLTSAQPESAADEVSTEKCPSPSGGRQPIGASVESPETDLSSLHNLRRYLALSTKVQKNEHQPATLSAIKIHGAAGGVGATTLAAILAKLIAKSNQRCAIVESTDCSALSVFFGLQRLDEQKRFLGVQSLFEPRIPIVNTRKPKNPFKPEANLIDWVTAEAGGDLDHVIFDRPTESSQSFGPALNICIAIPDVSSLIGARKLKIDFETGGDTSRTLCVLNRFNIKNSLHQEIRTWYQQNFSELVTVAESSLVPEALAEGATIVDWAPDDPVSADFLTAVNAIRLLVTAEDRVPVTICR